MHSRAVSGYEEEKRVMNLSLVAAVLLLIAKVTAAVATGSSAIYSDAAESVVHFLAVVFAAWALRLSHKPADETHHFAVGDVQRHVVHGVHDHRTPMGTQEIGDPLGRIQFAHEALGYVLETNERRAHAATSTSG